MCWAVWAAVSPGPCRGAGGTIPDPAGANRLGETRLSGRSWDHGVTPNFCLLILHLEWKMETAEPAWLSCSAWERPWLVACAIWGCCPLGALWGFSQGTRGISGGTFCSWGSLQGCDKSQRLPQTDSPELNQRESKHRAWTWLPDPAADLESAAQDSVQSVLVSPGLQGSTSPSSDPASSQLSS